MALKKIDKITRWRRTTQNKFGEFSFYDPEEIDVRWNDFGKEVTDGEGLRFIPQATIYHDTAGLINAGDRVSNILLADVDGDSLAESSIVRSTKISRNGSGTKFLYTAYLSHSSDGRRRKSGV